jgi:hypothetical protein
MPGIIKLSTVQFPGPAEWPEELADGPVVLLGQDLGGREQGGLAAVVGDLSIARTATNVLPEPTSPCSRRAWGAPVQRW